MPAIRTKNAAEIAVANRLESEGYTVLKNGWPDFLAFKGSEVRLIEVKPRSHRGLSKRQNRMAEALSILGLKVELQWP